MLVAGRYRIVTRLGRGGMGEVWRGVDEVLGRPVAVKLLLNQRADEAAIARFHLEARTAAQLSHPHVVAVYDTGTDLERHYLVTEFLDGRNLARLFHDGQIVVGHLPEDRRAPVVELGVLVQVG
ncbi:protein kinase domain-containing protein, partial [Streptomyces sp. NPDC001773]